jgi:hypothetical protein
MLHQLRGTRHRLRGMHNLDLLSDVGHLLVEENGILLHRKFVPGGVLIMKPLVWVQIRSYIALVFQNGGL